MLFLLFLKFVPAVAISEVKSLRIGRESTPKPETRRA
jgi:hypothetical protein